MDIVIVGAGIVGLTASLSLHQAGFRPVVYEVVRTLAPLGVGINALPHAVRELAALGLLDEVRAAGVEIDELVYLTARGQRIWREPRGLAAGYAWPQVAIHRGALQMLLLRAVQARLGPDAVRFGRALVDLETGETGVTARFSDRSSSPEETATVRADLLLAADGIHSTVRRQFYPGEGAPVWNGVTLWRSTSRSGKVLGGRSMLWAGRARQKFVAYPITYDAATGETLLNWICDLKDGEGAALPREDWNRPGRREDFLPRFEAWRWPGIDVPALVGTSGEIFEFPMVDRDPLPRWTFGRTTLMGDAAHPMYPIGSNGATQGIIDARAIAFHLATAPDVRTALGRYEGDRREATSRIVLMNRANGPDQVMELAQQRAPGPGDDLDALLPMSERAAIANTYKAVAGFDPAAMGVASPYRLPDSA